MIEARRLSKRYGDKLAVNDLSFSVQPGSVTGFLGPNGAGKSTTMRMILGLDAPTAGSVTVNGKPYADHARPLREVGALLEARAVHTGRTARRAGAFSLGMGQRLGIASALLADPRTLILDEPVNGLDPDGIRWIRTLLRGLADQGRTIFLSSHLMSEMALTADHVIVVGKGKLLRDQPMKEFIAAASADRVRVRSPQLDELRQALVVRGATLCSVVGDALEVEGLSTDEVGIVAAQARLTLFELTSQGASLEEAYMALTEESLDYPSTTRVAA
jgi:ABC-2 type transport system ATP-binding protein